VVACNAGSLETESNLCARAGCEDQPGKAAASRKVAIQLVIFIESFNGDHPFDRHAWAVGENRGRSPRHPFDLTEFTVR
jgi:hypothetical protein